MNEGRRSLKETRSYEKEEKKSDGRKEVGRTDGRRNKGKKGD
jgi:hypothetical protein